MKPNELFEKTIKAAKVIIETVPMQDDKNNYDMHDMRWVLKDPFFVMGMLDTVNKCVEEMGEQGIEEGVRIFAANAFSSRNKHYVINNAKERIKLLEGGM